MHFKALITGDMTLSILDEQGFKLIGVEMLSARTMQAETNGAKLARALNDLRLIAAHASEPMGLAWIEDYDDDAGVSPRPWRCQVDCAAMTLVVLDKNSKRIAGRRYPKGRTRELFIEMTGIIEKALSRINRLHPEMSVAVRDAKEGSQT